MPSTVRDQLRQATFLGGMTELLSREKLDRLLNPDAMTGNDKA